MNIPNRVRRTTRRIFAGIGILLCLGLFLSTGAPEKDIPGRTTIRLWNVVGAQETDPPAPGWFNEKQDRIYVKRIGVPFLEVERKFLTSAVGNCAPDLFEYFGPVAQWSSRGVLMPLNEFMERDGYDRDSVFPALWDEMTWENKIYAIPTGAASEAFYWNKEHFRQAGLDPDRPPQTWEELEAYALRLTLRTRRGEIERAGYIPGYWDPFGTALFAHWALQKGARFLSEDGRRVHLTSPACVEALEWEASLFEKLGRDELIKLRASFGYGSQQGFSSGRVSMIVQKSSFIEELAQFAPGIEYGVAPFPLPEEGKPAVMFGAVWIGIPASAKHPDEAWEFIKYYTQALVQKRVADFLEEQKLVGFFPANIEAAGAPSRMAKPGMAVFLESMHWAHTPTVIPLAHAVFWREYGNAWDEAVRGLKPARAALANAEKIIQDALDDQLEYDEFYRTYLREQEEAKERNRGTPVSFSERFRAVIVESEGNPQ